MSSQYSPMSTLSSPSSSSSHGYPPDIKVGTILPPYTQRRTTPADVAKAVKALLLATNKLMDTLAKWAVRQGTEEDVSDVYIRVGTDFNAVVHAFGCYGIDMSDLQSIPEDLRHVLESCLGEDPSPQLLQHYLPQLRTILYDLLQGLKMRQPLWRAASHREYGWL